MKLHLPKPLFVAVLAAFVSPAMYGYTLQTGEQSLTQDQTINDAQSLSDNVIINGYGWSYKPGYSLTLEQGADVAIDGELSIVSQCHLNIDGGSLSTTGQLSLGHDTAGNPADLTMTSGSLSVSQIHFNGDNANAVSITGGSLTITGENAINDGSGGRSTLTIGGTGSGSVTLKTGSNAIMFDYAGLQLGNVTVDAQNTQGITVANATLNGIIDNQSSHAFILSGVTNVGSGLVTVSDGSFYSDETTEIESGNGYYHATYTANIGTEFELAEGATLAFKGQTMAYDSATGIGTVTFTDMDTFYVREDTSYTAGLTAASNISVDAGITLDANGVAIEDKTIILHEGSTFANTGAEIASWLRQNEHIILEGNAAINATNGMGIIASSYTASALDLNGHTLTKEGDGTLTLINTTISEGTVDIQSGEVVLETRADFGSTSVQGTVFNVAENGSLTFNNFGGAAAGDVILNATGTGTINISSDTTISGKTGGGYNSSAFAGTVNVTGGQLSIGSNGTGGNSGWQVQAADMTIRLNGGNLYYFGYDSQLGNLEAAADATYTLHATENTHAVSHKGLNIAADATLHIKSNWTSHVSFDSLSGEGDLSLDRGSNTPNLTLTIGKVEDFQGSITINHGTLNLGADASSTVNIGKTITNSGTLNLNGSLSASSNGVYEIADLGSVSYSEGENGFRTTVGSTLYLAKGGTITLADAATFTFDGEEQSLTQTDSGLTFTTGKTTSSQFYVRQDTVSESDLLAADKVTADTAYILEGGTLEAAGSISNNRLSYTSGALSVSAGNSLTLDVAKDDVSNLLQNTIGAGNIEISNGITAALGEGTATQITGNLIVNSGSTLQLGQHTGSVTSSGTVNLDSLQALVLNGGTVSYRGGKGSLDNMEVTAASTLNMWDMNSTAADNAFKIGSLTLRDTLTVTTSWKYNLNIGALTGSGDLALNAQSHDNQVVSINVAQGYTGKVLLNGGTNMAVSLSVEEGATAQIKGRNIASFTTSISSLTLHNGSTLKANTDGANQAGGQTFTLSQVTVDGAAELLVDGDNAYQGLVNIENLTNGKDAESGAIAKTGVLTLTSNSKTSYRTIFNLNGGDFEGTIKVAQIRSGDDRKAALNIKHATAAEKAVIDLNAVNGAVALGLAADEVAVRGITGASGAIYSGEQAGESHADFAGDNTDRTLVIKTAGGNYSTAATLGGHINLTKQGEGSQGFTGVAPSDIGTIKVEAGELAFTNLATLTVTDLTVKSGATLTLGSPVQTFAEGTAPTYSGTVVVSSTATLEGGAAIQGGLDLTTTRTLVINSLDKGSITLGGALILPDGKIALSGDILNSLAGLGEGNRLDVFSGVTSLTLGDAVYNTELPATVDTDLSNYFTGVAAEQYFLGYTEGGVVYIQSNVPEPATATLSLLALAALAARRRRR